MIREGRSFSGRERNCCFLNIGSGPFADVSSITKWDLIDDGRAMALVDWDSDGDLDFWLANRTAPRLRLLRNDLAREHGFLRLRLEGRGPTCNRDAIGARLELLLDGPEPQTRIKTVAAGSGFLSQSSKWVHFGLGSAAQIARLTVRWPDGTVERFDSLEPNRHYHIVHGTGQARPWQRPGDGVRLKASPQPVPPADDEARIVLSAPLPLPELKYKDLDENDQSLDQRGGPLLVNLWATWCGPCVKELSQFAEARRQFEGAGLQVLALMVPQSSSGDPAPPGEARRFVERLGLPMEAGTASQTMVRDMDLVQRSAISLQQPLPLPSSFLLDRQRRLRVIYKGPVEIEQLLEDVRKIEESGHDPIDDAAAFAGRWHTRPVGITPMSVAMKFIEDGQHDAAKRYLRRVVATTGELRQSPATRRRLAGMYHVVGALLLDQGERREAIASFQEALQVDADFWRSHFDLGILFLKGRRHEQAIHHFSQALRIKPEDADMLNKLGLATMGLRQPREAAGYFRRALSIEPNNVVALFNMGLAQMQIGNARSAVDYFSKTIKLSPDDAQAHFYLGNLLGQAGQSVQAVHHYRQALRLRPGWPVAANNAAWLLATSADPAARDADRAVQLAEWVVQRTGRRQPGVLDTLAVAYAAAGRFDEAMETTREAIQRAQSQENSQLAAELRKRLQLYQSQRPYRGSVEGD